MSGAAAAFHLWGACWAAAMSRACWQGGGAIVLAWALCRLLPRLSGPHQCWLWRLAYLKPLVAFFWTAPLALPLLTAPAASPELSSGLADLPRPSPASTLIPGYLDAGADTGRREPFNVRLGLLLIWIPGCACGGLQLFRSWRRSRRLLATGKEIRDEALLAARRALCDRMGVRPEPALLTTEELACPVLVGIGAPAVLLPASFPADFDAAQLRLMLAHELAHLKRRDLLWAWLPNLGRLLFFFHPLVWMAEREWRLAQEMACDEQALLATGACPQQYGTLLLEIIGQVQRDCPSGLLAISVAGSYATVRRRLEAIQRHRSASLPGSRALQFRLAASMLLVTGVIAGIVPWRLTARAAAPPPPGRGRAIAVEIEQKPGAVEQPRAFDDLAAERAGAQPLAVPARGRVSSSLPSAGERASGSEPGLAQAASDRAPSQDATKRHSGAAGPTDLARAATPYTRNPVIIAAEPRPRLPARLRQESTRSLPVTVAAAPPAARPGSAAVADGQAPSGPDKQPSLSPGLAAMGDGPHHADEARPDLQKIALLEGEEPLSVLHTPKALAVPAAFIGWKRAPLSDKMPGLGVWLEAGADPRDLKKMFIALRRGQSIDPRAIRDTLAAVRPEDRRAFKEMLGKIARNAATENGLPEEKPVFLVSKGILPFDKQMQEKLRRDWEAMGGEQKLPAGDANRNEKPGAVPDEELAPDF